MSEDPRIKDILFNDITYAPTDEFILLSDRQAIADYLYQKGWRREVQPEDVTER